MPLRWIRRIMKDLAADTDHANGNVTASRTLACPRAVLIEDFLPCTPSITSFNKMMWGIAIHEAMEPLAQKPPRFTGKVLGVEMSGEPDELDEMIVDIKTHGEYSHKKSASGGASPELAVQINIYRILAEQNKYEVKGLAAWHGAMLPETAMFGPNPIAAWVWQEVPRMTEEEIALVQPYGSGYTVRQIVKYLHEGASRIRAGEDPVKVVRDTPLVGEKMFNGKKCQFYCSVNEECGRVEGRKGL